PQQNDRRNLLDLSGLWDFQIDPEDEGVAAGWFNGLEPARPIAVPASWNEQYQDTRDYLGAAWYVQRFIPPASWQGERIWLRVGSANYGARVWLNGVEIGRHEGGHLPFVFEVTEHVRLAAENLLAIRVENELRPTRVPPGNIQGGGLLAGFMGNYPATAYDFFPYGGLHRPVHLYTTPARAITDVTVVTDIAAADGVVHVRVKQNTPDGFGQVRLQDGSRTLDAPLRFADGVAEATLQVADARFWSPQDPHLYPLTVVLSDGDQVVDRYTLDVGIRTIAVEGDRILLNGEPITLTGFGKHEDFPIHGRGLDLPVLVKDYMLLKWIGANSYRTSHYPYSEEAMRLADREGILIIDEIPAVGLFFEDGPENIQTRLEQCKQQVRELVARDKNHPSVIMWSVANEPIPPNMMQRFMGGEAPPVDPATTDFFAQLIHLTRSLDPTRPVTLVGVHGCPVEWLALTDVVCINRYYGWYTQGGQLDLGAQTLAQELDALHEALGKPIIITEFGADTIPGVHSDPPEMFTEEYQVEMLRRYLDVAAERPFVAGMHVWNFADFKTAQGSRRPAGMNFKGVFTRDRRPKMAAHFLRERWVR
ncbi:MAG: beta-glucuronidase, partial [Caldilineae bacterium]